MQAPTVTALFVAALLLSLATKFWLATRQMRHVAAHRVLAGQVHAAMRAAHHGQGLAGARPSAHGRAGALAPAPPQPDAHQHRQQHDQQLHAVRPSSTSSTKREPT